MKKVQLLLATLLLAIIPFSGYGLQAVQGDVNGYLVSSMRNGNSLFLPATGTFLMGEGSEARYWSRSLDSSYNRRQRPVA